jgi:hypothetical protein
MTQVPPLPKSKGGEGDCGPQPPIVDNGQHIDYPNESTQGKALALMQARLTACGIGLHELSDQGYYLSGSGLAYQVPDLRAVGQLLRRIGVAT